MIQSSISGRSDALSLFPVLPSVEVGSVGDGAPWIVSAQLEERCCF